MQKIWIGLIITLCVITQAHAIESGNVIEFETYKQKTDEQIQKLQAQITDLQKQVDRLRVEQSQTSLFKTNDNPAAPASKPTQSRYGMEKCKVVDSHGNGLIKAYMADSGNNLEGDRDAWIWVPSGQCKKINKGDFNGVSEEIQYKIHGSYLTPSP
jgi:hypothetical protein